MSKDILGQAVIDASESKPTEFNGKLNTVVTDKIKTKMNKLVQELGKDIFKKR